MTHEKIFTPQYTDRSGPGSTVEFSAPYRSFVERFIIENRIKSVYDLGCGDGVVASNIDYHGALYLGIDCIAERVERNRMLYGHIGQFECRDLRSAHPRSDLVLVKDVIQHWTTDEIIAWLAHMRRCAFRYALITNCTYGETVNTDVETGGWRAIDLTKPPFGVGQVVFQWGEPNKDVVLLAGAGA